MKIRIKFSKHGMTKFIGHLDVQRYFQKANRRAGLDVEYSIGFSPHQIMSFAAPLGVGLESDGEYFDLAVNSVTDGRDMMERLKEQMSPGFDILGMYLLPDDTKNAMASVAAAAYRIDFRDGREPGFDLTEAVKWFEEVTNVTVLKKTKKSEISLDIKPSVFALSTEKNSVMMTVDASSGGNIKPELVINSMYEHFGEEMKKNALLITRMETFTRTEEGELIPLSDIGSEF